jgi:hypothetical protein
VARHSPHRGGTGVSDAWAPADSGREREKRGAGHVGRPGKKEAWAARRNKNIFDLFK